MISYEIISGYNNKKDGIKCMICNHYHFNEKIIINHMFVIMIMS